MENSCLADEPGREYTAYVIPRSGLPLEECWSDWKLPEPSLLQELMEEMQHELNDRLMRQYAASELARFNRMFEVFNGPTEKDANGKPIHE